MTSRELISMFRNNLELLAKITSGGGGGVIPHNYGYSRVSAAPPPHFYTHTVCGYFLPHSRSVQCFQLPADR